MNDSQTLSRWLLGHGEPPSAHVLRRMGLAAHAYTVLPVEHEQRPSLRPDFLVSLRRHEEIKRELVPLLAAWRAEGLDVLLFKGFHLAEFVYPAPGARFHGDVDLLMRPEHLARAAEIARAMGWHEVGPRAPGPSFSHHAFTLLRLGGATLIEVHRWMVHARLPWSGVQRRITEAVWRASAPCNLEGVQLREPSPVDALLVGVVLQRFWSLYPWELKPFDVVDFQHLTTRRAVRREELWVRARELRCERTLAIFLDRCDPDRGCFEFTPPRQVETRRWNAAVFRERGLLGAAENGLARVLGAPAIVYAGAAFVPLLIRVRWHLRRRINIRELLRALTPYPDRLGSAKPGEPERVVAGVRWATRLVGVGSHGAYLVRSLAIYSSLRRRGWPVVFVTGVRRADGRVAGHAWVEYCGVVLWELKEPDNRILYEVDLQYPGKAMARGSPVDERGPGSPVMPAADPTHSRGGSAR